MPLRKFLTLLTVLLVNPAVALAGPNGKKKAPLKQEAPSCQVVTVTPAGKLIDFKAPAGLAPEATDDLAATISSIASAMEAGDAKKLAGLFHPRLRLTDVTVGSQLAEIRARYGDPVSFRPLKVMVVRSPGGDQAPVTCDFDGVVLNPLHGYEHQASLWMQASGQQDIARVMMGIVPLPGRLGGGWRIGYFHTQQWTHSGRDPLAWIEAARAAKSAKQTVAAWTMFDMTSKLLRPTQFATYQAHTMVEGERDAVMSRGDWLAVLVTLSPELKVEDAVSLLVPEGAGILLKIRLVKELSSNNLQEHCRATVKNLLARDDAKGLAAIRCEYYRPGESLEKNSTTGGYLIPARA